MNNRRILLVASQHGDELLGERLYSYIKTHRPTLVDMIAFIVANPKARKLKTRFIASDMNRSYVLAPHTYEEKRAAYVKNKIDQGNYEIVLDLHTTTCVQETVFLIRDINALNAPYLRASHIRHVIEMHHSVVDQSLIGVVPHALSVEVSRADMDDALLGRLADDIERYLSGGSKPKKKYVYRVNHLLLKAECARGEAKRLVNLRKSRAGYYPILVGEASYKKNTPYLGFRASERREVEV